MRLQSVFRSLFPVSRSPFSVASFYRCVRIACPGIFPPMPEPEPTLSQAALARCELFRGLSEAERDRVLALARACVFEDGASVVREDDEAKDLFVIVAGRGEVEVAWPFGAGHPHRIGEVRRGDLIGEMTLVDRCLRSASVRAVGTVEALAIPHDELRRLLEESPVLGYRIMENVARLLALRMRETNLKLRNTIASLLT